MSVKLMGQVFEAKFKHPSEKWVMIVLANYANDDGCNAYPSVATIARSAGISDRAVQLALRNLAADGLIVQDGVWQSINGPIPRYRILVDKLPTGETASPVKPVHPVKPLREGVKPFHPTGEMVALTGEMVSPNPLITIREPSVPGREPAAAGAPLVDLPACTQGESPAEVLQGRAFNRVLTELVVFAGSGRMPPLVQPALDIELVRLGRTAQPRRPGRGQPFIQGPRLRDDPVHRNRRSQGPSRRAGGVEQGHVALLWRRTGTAGVHDTLGTRGVAAPLRSVVRTPGRAHPGRNYQGLGDHSNLLNLVIRGQSPGDSWGVAALESGKAASSPRRRGCDRASAVSSCRELTPALP